MHHFLPFQSGSEATTCNRCVAVGWQDQSGMCNCERYVDFTVFWESEIRSDNRITASNQCAGDSRWTLGNNRPETSCERSPILRQNTAFCVISKWRKVIFHPCYGEYNVKQKCIHIMYCYRNVIDRGLSRSGLCANRTTGLGLLHLFYYGHSMNMYWLGCWIPVPEVLFVFKS